MRILIYEIKGQNLHFAGRVENLVYEEGPAETPATTYRFQGNTSQPLKVGGTYRFMVTANYPGMETPENGEGPVFDLAALHPHTGGLPLWGVTTHTVDFSAVQYLEDICLLRSAAKVEVKLDEPLKQAGYELSQVRISPSVSRGYVFPKAWRQAAFTSDLSAESEHFHPVAVTGSPASPLYFTPSPEDSADYQIYLPEYTNHSGAEAKISLTVTNENGTQDYVDAIEFKKYQDGKVQEGTQYNLVRNRYYQFVVREANIGYPLYLDSQILPWIVEEESWDYTDHVSIRSEGKMHWETGTFQRIDPATGEVVMLPGKPMVCHFQIDTPLEAWWHASFIALDGSDDVFRFETFAVDDGKHATGKVGEPVRLQIRALRGATDRNDAALLRIVVRTRGGQTLWVKNLLPDEFQHISEYTIVQSK